MTFPRMTYGDLAAANGDAWTMNERNRYRKGTRHMNILDIDLKTLEPGKELDDLIREHVFGWERVVKFAAPGWKDPQTGRLMNSACEHPSTNEADALKLLPLFDHFQASKLDGEPGLSFAKVALSKGAGSAASPKVDPEYLPLAICITALDVFQQIAKGQTNA